MIYNDAYSAFAGGRHPNLLGSKVREGWPEAAEFNDNVMKVGLAGGTLAYRDQELILRRNGEAETVWMNLDYSPVLDESGQPGGVMAIVVETTERVLADRRIAVEQQRRRQLFSQMPGFVCVLAGPEHVYEYVNDAYLKISGRDSFIGRSVREMFPELEKESGQQKAYAQLSDEILFDKKWVKVEVQPEDLPGFKGPRVVCAECREGINFKREIVRDGRALCRSCAGEKYYRES